MIKKLSIILKRMIGISLALFLSLTFLHKNISKEIQVKDFYSITPAEYSEYLERSKGSKTLILVAAQWCTSCKEVEGSVFKDEEILGALKSHGYNLIILDITKINESQSLLKQLDILGPPTILFYNEKGEELPNTRIVGKIDVKTFKEFLSKVFEDRATH